MSHDITVILAKASWCHYCDDFSPIYELAQKKIKSSDFDNCSINLVSFIMDRPGEKEKFEQQYPGLLEYLEGYPTVYFQMSEKKSGSRPKTEFINHTIAREKGEKGIEKAVQEFIQNIKNKYKSIKSGNKEEYTTVQRGGMLKYMTLEEEKYRNKYLKYKSKYLELKNQ